MKENKITFSFLEKGFIAMSLLIAVIAAYFMPVGAVWKPAAGSAVFSSLLAGWMLIEGVIQEEKMGKRNIWGCIIFATIFFALWFGYSQGAKSGHIYLSVVVAFFISTLILVGVESFFEKFFEEDNHGKK